MVKGKSVLTRKSIYKKFSFILAISCLSGGLVLALGSSIPGLQPVPLANGGSFFDLGSTDAFATPASVPTVGSGAQSAAASGGGLLGGLAADATGGAATSSASMESTEPLAAPANTPTAAKPTGTLVPAQRQDQIFPDMEELVFVSENKILMDYLFSGINGFAKISEDERACVEAGHARGSVYGEIPYDSLQVILENELIGPNDVFYDFGSGVGKVVTQVYLNTPVRKAVGIEASVSRYNGCMRMMEKFKATDPYTDRKYNAKARRTITFINKNFLKVDVSDATIIYMCATCFEPGLMEKLVQKFEKINRIGLRVITLKKLPEHEKHGFRFDRGYKLPMSWSRSGRTSSVFVYTYVGNLLR